MRISVMAQDIAAGVQHEPGECPIALAVRRQTPYLSALVSRSGIILADGTDNWLPISRRTKEWLLSYDIDGLGMPFEFNLKIAKEA